MSAFHRLRAAIQEACELAPGTVFHVPYPFVRDTFRDEAGAPVPTWKPGVRFEYGVSYHPEVEPPTEAVADGIGKMVLTVVSVHKPGRFPTRVFYTRQWVPPEGKPFGKDALRVASQAAFCRRATRYQHDFRLVAPSPSGARP